MSDKKIKTISDIKKLHQQWQAAEKDLKTKVLICTTGCRALGALKIAKAFRQRLQSLEIDKKIQIKETGCIGMCSEAPVVLIEPYGYLYGRVKISDVDEIVSTTLQGGKPIGRLAVSQDRKKVVNIEEVNFNENNKKFL